MSTVMMNVKNLHNEDYTEEFKGEIVTVPAGKSIVMTKGDAVMFLASMSVNDRRTGKPKVKMLEMKPVDITAPAEEKNYICNYDGKNFETEAELIEHLKIHKDKVYEDKNKEDVKKEETMKCPLCVYRCNSEQLMKAHLAQHIKK